MRAGPRPPCPVKGEWIAARMKRMNSHPAASFMLGGEPSAAATLSDPIEAVPDISRDRRRFAFRNAQ
jgi:hypothetical protein